MAFLSRMPGALAILLYLQCCNVVRAQNQSLPGFGDTVQVLGNVSHEDSSAIPAN